MELKSVDVMTFEKRITEVLNELVQTKYDVTISKIEYKSTTEAKIELVVSPSIIPFSDTSSTLDLQKFLDV